MTDATTETPPSTRLTRWPKTPVRRVGGIAAVLAGVALAAAACGSGSSAGPSTTGAPRASGGHAVIVIQNFSFAPDSVTVAPGATVTVKNQDTATHTVTSTSQKFDTGDVAPGKTATFTAPSAAGRYPFRCTIHQYMTGTLVVS